MRRTSLMLTLMLLNGCVTTEPTSPVGVCTIPTHKSSVVVEACHRCETVAVFLTCRCPPGEDAIQIREGQRK